MDSVIATIDQCNQRGGRPLSVIDLVERKLLTLNQAAWLVSRIEEGSSWLVGAIPGHAGKTTLMSALLVFLPPQVRVTLANMGHSWETFGEGCCVVAEEISDHQRGRYLWDEDVRGLTSVPAQGGRIATTIHAVTLEGVRDQVSRQCDAGENGVAAFGMFIPIEVTYGPDSQERGDTPQGGKRRRPIESRTVEFIHYFDDRSWHTIDREIRLTSQQESTARFLHSCLKSGVYTCEALRKAWLAEEG